MSDALKEPRKILIQKAWYDAETDSVFWEVQFEDTKTHATLMWIREEFGSSFNIPYEIPPPHVIEFCQKMEGKTISIQTPESVRETKGVPQSRMPVVHRAPEKPQAAERDV